nr:leucyl aminopeptidase [Salirhabdus sp. Marseille-P4669]
MKSEYKSVQGDAIIIGLFEESQSNHSLYNDINKNLDNELELLMEDGDLSKAYKSITKLYTNKRLEQKRLYVIGLGKKNELTLNQLRNVFGTLFKQLHQDKNKHIVIDLDYFATPSVSIEQVAEVLAEALPMATYAQPVFKTIKKDNRIPIERVTIISNVDKEIVKKALEKGYAFGKGTTLARYLVHIPGNMLTATKLAERALQIAKEYQMEYEILEKEDMERLGMGALLAVNQGSTEPPKMIVLKYQGQAEWKDAIALVGKGITFDTGGYSIKSKNGLMGMKNDMGGAAAVLGAMATIGKLKPKKNVIAVIPSTDNMISGNAFKPDDVIFAMSGKSIEVRNTDAEGRLALADAITYAKRFHVDKIVDVATLTGGVITALGDKLTGAMTNDQDFYKEVEIAANYVDEPIWQLPYNDHFKQQVRNSDVADLNNSPGRKGHAILAGAFLAEFAEATPWVHLDIAGTAMADTNHNLGPKGSTGVMARTLAKLIIN